MGELSNIIVMIRLLNALILLCISITFAEIAKTNEEKNVMKTNIEDIQKNNEFSKREALADAKKKDEDRNNKNSIKKNKASKPQNKRRKSNKNDKKNNKTQSKQKRKLTNKIKSKKSKKKQNTG